MKLEFLANGSPDCPLIRIYEFNSKEAYKLRRIALQLAKAGVRLYKQPKCHGDQRL